jgi:heat-inducible transcriptional repressor
MTFASQSHYDRSKVAKLDIVRISDSEALLLIITNSAKVETETIKIPEFQDVRRIRNIVNVIEKRSIRKSLEGPKNGLSVMIGKDNEVGIDDCTVISIPYQIGDENGGTIAVIGPKRMEYKKVIPLLEYLAKNMSKLFKE